SFCVFFFFSSRRRHTRFSRDWSSDVCSSDLASSRLKDRITEERAKGATVILTSHVMSELEELADEVLFLLEGSVRFRGTIESIRDRTGERKLERAVARLMQDGAEVDLEGVA